MALIWGLLGSEAVQSLTPRTSLHDRRMLVGGAWGPTATSEFKTALDRASADAGCGTMPGGAPSEAAFGCRRSLKWCVWPRCSSLPVADPTRRRRSEWTGRGEVNSAGPRAASVFGAQKERGRVASASTTPRFGVEDP